MNNEFTQEELKELFFKIMTEDEIKKLDELEMNQEISKLNTSTFQIKYFNGIGYVFIGNGYLMMTDGTEKQQYFCTVCKDEETAKQEVIDRLNKLPNENQTTNNEEYYFYKNKEEDTIWWVRTADKNIGEHLFTFDKKKIFNLFRDYPHELTEEQKEIFDKENPYWVDFFKDRK